MQPTVGRPLYRSAALEAYERSTGDVTERARLPLPRWPMVLTVALVVVGLVSAVVVRVPGVVTGAVVREQRLEVVGVVPVDGGTPPRPGAAATVGGGGLDPVAVTVVGVRRVADPAGAARSGIPATVALPVDEVTAVRRPGRAEHDPAGPHGHGRVLQVRTSDPTLLDRLTGADG